MQLRILCFLLASLLAQGAQMEIEKRLAAAIHKETVAGDLKAAIDEFKAIAAAIGQNRQVAATALQHLAACYEKLGLMNEADNVYRRILREYVDQPDAAKAARQKVSVAPVIGIPANPMPSNLNLEHGEVGKMPPGWFVPQASSAAGYSAELRRSGCDKWASCAVVTTPTQPVSGMYGHMGRIFDAAPFRGKTLRLRSRLKLEGKTGDSASMYLKVLRPDQKKGFLDNMGNRMVTSAAWTDAEIVGTIDDDAISIMLGVTSNGSGRTWVEGMRLELVPDDTPETVFRNKSSNAPFGNGTATFPNTVAAGKKIKYSGYIKTEGITSGYAGLFWAATAGKSAVVDDMKSHGASGTTDWKRYEIELQIPVDASEIRFGVIHPGTGTAWFDSLAIEIDGVPYVSNHLFDLDFETLTGFKTSNNGYEVGLDNKVFHSGRSSLRSKNTNGTAIAWEPTGPKFGEVTYTLPLAAAKGKTVRYSGFIKTENLTDGFAGLWWRVDGAAGSIAFDNMNDRGPRGTSEWGRYEINLRVPADATNINFGVLQTGKGTAWFDALIIELDGISYTDKSLFDLDFETPSIVGANTGGEGYKVTLDKQTVFRGVQSLKIQNVGTARK